MKVGVLCVCVSFEKNLMQRIWEISGKQFADVGQKIVTRKILRIRLGQHCRRTRTFRSDKLNSKRSMAFAVVAVQMLLQRRSLPPLRQQRPQPTPPTPPLLSLTIMLQSDDRAPSQLTTADLTCWAAAPFAVTLAADADPATGCSGSASNSDGDRPFASIQVVGTC